MLPFPQQGAARIEAEEARVRASSGDDCDMTLKNNIEGRNKFNRVLTYFGNFVVSYFGHFFVFWSSSVCLHLLEYEFCEARRAKWKFNVKKSRNQNDKKTKNEVTKICNESDIKCSEKI